MKFLLTTKFIFVMFRLAKKAPLPIVDLNSEDCRSVAHSVF